MSILVKQVKLEATAEMDVSRFRSGLAQLKSIKRQLESQTIRMPVRLDLSGIRSDASRAAAEYKKSFSAALGTLGASAAGGTTSKGGIFLTPSAMADLGKASAAAGKEIKRVTDFAADGSVKAVKSLKQLEDGLQRLETTRKKKGKMVTEGSVIDTRPAVAMRRQMDQLERDFGSRIGATKAGKGDLAAVLNEQKSRVLQAIKNFADLEGTPEYGRAVKLVDSLDRRIAESGVKQGQQAAKDSAAREARMRSVGGSLDKQRERELKRQAGDVQKDSRYSAQRAIAREDRSLQTKIKSNKEDEAAAKATSNRIIRESELNRVMAAREKLLRDQADRYDQLSRRQRALGRTGAADKFEDAGGRQRNAANQVALDRERSRQAAGAKMNDQQLDREIARKVAAYRLDRERLNSEERLAKKTADRSAREKALNDILARRQALSQSAARDLGGLRDDANQRGNNGLFNKARYARESVVRDAIRDQNRFDTATRRSGHALDFHSSSLLRNAASFAKWGLAMQAVMLPLRAISAGLANAVDAERTFKVLEAVFRGSKEEAALLANQTLLLAAANGRSADEAAQSAVAWARMGLTRTQVLLAMETSLRAANVAEITTAEATKYLIASYVGLDMTLADVAVSLDYINALSNKANVTPKDLFEGISRTAKAAKQAGMEFEDLAGIITVVTAATGRPGQEIGNAMKFIINRARTPEVMKALKLEFGIDIRTPEGDVKRFSDVLADLASIYPNLSRLEKARLNDIVAGARQGNRFAIVMENYTDSLIAQAGAGFDANSALRENASILESVDAQLQAVGTSWTAMMLALGNAGVFDTTAQGLHSIADALRSVSSAQRGVKPGGFEISDRGSRAAMGTLLNDRGLFQTSARNRSKEEIQETIDRLKAIDATSRGAPAFGTTRVMKDGSRIGTLYNRTRQFANDKGDSIKLEAGETWQDVIRKFESMLGDVTGERDTSAAAGSAKEILQAQNRVTSLFKAQESFQAIARDIQGVEVDPQKILKQFDSAAEKMEQLPGGLRNVADARLNLRPMIERGDYAGAAAGMRGVAGRFRSAGEDELARTEVQRKASLEATGKVIDQTRAKLTELNQAMAGETDGKVQETTRRDIAETTDRLKEQEDAWRSLNNLTTRTEADPLAGGKAERLADYFKELKLAAEVMGGLMEGFANTGFGDLDAKLKIGAARLQGDLVEKSLMNSRSQNGGRMDALRDGIGAISDTSSPAARQKLDLLREELATHQAIDDTLTNELESVRAASAEIERKLELERQAARLKEAYDDGATGAASVAQRYAIGRSEGERIVNQTRGVFQQLNGGNVMGSLTDPFLGRGDAAQSARELGQITQNLAAGKQGLAQIEDRMNRAIAERANLEGTISEEQRKQREEASKRIALASREDQLRAAGTAALLRSRGQSQFSRQEFQYFSQETRGALSNLSPGSVAGFDVDARTNAESRAKLDQEIKLLAASLTVMRKEFDNVRPYAEQRAGGLLDGKGIGGASGQSVTDLNKAEIKVNLSMGETVIQLDFSRHVQEIRSALQSHLDIRMDEVLRELRGRDGRFDGPDTSAANAAF